MYGVKGPSSREILKIIGVGGLIVATFVAPNLPIVGFIEANLLEYC